jgi:zinc protease
LLAGRAGATEVVALPANDHPLVALSVTFRTGSVDDPTGKAGITDLAAVVMAEGGTEKLDAKALAAALFPMAAGIHVHVDKEVTTFRTVVHRDNLDKMVAIFTDVIAHPRWDDKEFTRLRDDAVNDIEKRLRQGDDENLGKEALSELMYTGRPYGRLSIGHVKDLRSITLAELKAHAASVFVQNRVIVGVAGGYPATLPAQLERALAALPAGELGTLRILGPAAKPPSLPRFRLVEKNTDSTAISLGFPYGLSRKDPDFVAMTVGRSAFGEHRQFNGRLMQRLREQRGLNYGDYAYIEHFEQEGWDASQARTGLVRKQQDFTVWLRPVQNDNALFALRAALYELERSTTTEPFSTDEVESTKQFLDGYVRLFAQNDARQLGYAVDDRLAGTEGDGGFLASWRKRLAAVTPAQVNAAWKKWMGAGKIQIVMVSRGAEALKKTILAGTPTPMHYEKDAQGKTAVKPKALLDADAVIEKKPFGVSRDADVEVIPVEKLFE